MSSGAVQRRNSVMSFGKYLRKKNLLPENSVFCVTFYSKVAHHSEYYRRHMHLMYTISGNVQEEMERERKRKEEEERKRKEEEEQRRL